MFSFRPCVCLGGRKAFFVCLFVFKSCILFFLSKSFFEGMLGEGGGCDTKEYYHNIDDFNADVATVTALAATFFKL